MKSEIVIAKSLVETVVDCEYFSCGFAEAIRALNASEGDLHVMLNMAQMGMDAPLPPIPDRDWYPMVDTLTARPPAF
ncbi:MAG: hypothetical protein JO251_07005 [Verrucomicrobia bacterium]|jgi:hypothetical protein|nr:hypothetical protein [Verrucomicrobiota bacterium]MBV8639798.1 hypothetical protein [Verrucomicrobiota bacterium]